MIIVTVSVENSISSQFVYVVGWVALAQALGGLLPTRFWAMGKSKRESGSRKAPKKTKKDDGKKKRKDKKKKPSSSSSSDGSSSSEHITPAEVEEARKIGQTFGLTLVFNGQIFNGKQACQIPNNYDQWWVASFLLLNINLGMAAAQEGEATDPDKECLQDTGPEQPYPGCSPSQTSSRSNRASAVSVRGRTCRG